MNLDKLHYNGHPGGRPRWHFHDVKETRVAMPKGKHDAKILKRLALGNSTANELASLLGLKGGEFVSSHVIRLEAGGYIARSANDGRNSRQIRLTAYGARALEAI